VYPLVTRRGNLHNPNDKNDSGGCFQISILVICQTVILLLLPRKKISFGCHGLKLLELPTTTTIITAITTASVVVVVVVLVVVVIP
jgi:hypothetical protein